MQARRFIARFENGERQAFLAASFEDAALVAAELCPLTGETAIDVSDAETGETERLTLDIARTAPAVRRRPRRAAA